jgi:hypothetical protein
MGWIGVLAWPPLIPAFVRNFIFLCWRGTITARAAAAPEQMEPRRNGFRRNAFFYYLW